MYKFLLYD